LQKIGGDILVQLQRRVAGDDLPVAIERESRAGLLPVQHQVDCGTRGRQRGIVQRPFGKDRREPGRDQKNVALAHRHVELLREQQHHVAAWLRPPRFHETQMPRRNPGIAGEIKLAQAPALPPLAQKAADRQRAIEHLKP
jgi:hypothetical protein